MIYLDHNATTPIASEVLEVMPVLNYCTALEKHKSGCRCLFQPTV